MNNPRDIKIKVDPKLPDGTIEFRHPETGETQLTVTGVGLPEDMPDSRDGERLRDAIIEAAQRLVHKHVESEIVADKDNTYLRLLIRPTTAQSFGRYLSEGDESDNLFTALADLLGAVDAYEDWETEQSS